MIHQLKLVRLPFSDLSNNKMTGSKVINDNTPESPEDMQIEKNSEHVEHNEASSMPSLQDEVFFYVKLPHPDQY